MSISYNSSSAFTLVEVIVAITVMSILSVIVFETLGNYFYANTTSLSTTIIDTDTRGALREVVDDLALSNNFLDSATVQYSEYGPTGQPGGTGPDLTWQSATGNTILLATVPATNAGNTMVALTSNMGDCSPHNAGIMKNLLIYFIKNDSLYRRTVVNWTGDTPCAGYAPNTQTSQKTTCFPRTTSSRCFGVDALLLSNATSLTTTYYTAAGTIVSGPSISTSAKTVELKIDSSKTINGTRKQSSAKIRFSLIAGP